METENVYAKKNGKDLFEMYQNGDFEAGYWFARLVFNAKYKPNLIDGISKKELNEKTKKDAEDCIIAGAEACNFNCMHEAADMYFTGRREPGTFGSTIFNAQYAKSKTWYLKLLELSSIDNEKKGLATFRLGMLSFMMEDGTVEESVDFWNKARGISSEYSKHAIARLATHYYEIKDYDKAVPLLESIYKQKPYSAILLSQCYRNGYGVDVNLIKSAELTEFWQDSDNT
ncbi:tetratricopeptide repeat protein [Colwelliaceae bacterium BS250]